MAQPIARMRPRRVNAVFDYNLRTNGNAMFLAKLDSI
jgi:hypothetical protein